MLLAIALGEEHGHAPPATVFTPLWRVVRETEFGKWMGFAEMHDNRGQYWFEAICFSVLAALVLAVCGFLATRRYERVPRGLQNVFEVALDLLRKLVHGMIGPAGDRYLPYLASLFLFIFTMNMVGLVPAFRAPTMTLSTTAALGLTTFFMVQGYAIRAGGIVHYVKHFMGDVLWLSPLMLVVEILGELAKPLSLSMRLFGNISGEDNVVEQLMILGGWVPVHAPMLAFGVFTSFLQAFVFTALASIYIGTKLPHEEHREHEGPGAEKASHHAH